MLQQVLVFLKKKFLVSVLAIFILLLVLFQIAGRTTRAVVIEHTFDADVIEVWQVWTNVDTIKQWWGPRGYTAPIVRHELKEGGSFLLSMKAPDGTMSYNSGRYTEVVPLQKISSAMWFSDEHGAMVPASTYGLPGKWPDEVTVVVTFANDSGRTKVRIVETGIPLIMSFFAKMGWKQQLEKIDNIVLL